jgi:hypothetical protein
MELAMEIAHEDNGARGDPIHGDAQAVGFVVKDLGSRGDEGIDDGNREKGGEALR